MTLVSAVSSKVAIWGLQLAWSLIEWNKCDLIQRRSVCDIVRDSDSSWHQSDSPMPLKVHHAEITCEDSASTCCGRWTWEHMVQLLVQDCKCQEGSRPVLLVSLSNVHLIKLSLSCLKNSFANGGGLVLLPRRKRQMINLLACLLCEHFTSQISTLLQRPSSWLHCRSLVA